MIPALRRVGFRWRPQLGLSREEVAEIVRMAGWMFGYIVTTQVGLLVTQNLANDAAVRSEAANIGYGAGFSAYQYAWLLFQLPYAIVGISVITALLPRMSAHAADARYALVRQDFSAGVRLASVITVPAAVVLAVLAPSAGDPAARARQHNGSRRHLRRRGVRRLLRRSRALHALPVAAAGVLRDARQPDNGVHRACGDGGEHRGERGGLGTSAGRPDHGGPCRRLRHSERGREPRSRGGSCGDAPAASTASGSPGLWSEPCLPRCPP